MTHRPSASSVWPGAMYRANRHSNLPPTSAFGSRPSGQLSGAEQQSGATARGLASQCRRLLFDEPTAGLGPRTAGGASPALAELVCGARLATPLATQRSSLAEKMGRAVSLHEG